MEMLVLFLLSSRLFGADAYFLVTKGESLVRESAVVDGKEVLVKGHKKIKARNIIRVPSNEMAPHAPGTWSDERFLRTALDVDQDGRTVYTENHYALGFIDDEKEAYWIPKREKFLLLIIIQKQKWKLKRLNQVGLNRMLNYGGEM
jgi:hypothetical protein